MAAEDLQNLPPEPGLTPDLHHGLAELPEGVPQPAREDNSTEDEDAEVNDYDAYPDDPDEED